MQLWWEAPGRRRLWIAVAAAGVIALIWALRGPLLQVAALVLTAAALCFAALPLARLLEKKLPRHAAALCALLAIAIVLGLLLWLLLPAMLRELMDLARTLPDAVARLSGLLDDGRDALRARFPGLTLPGLDLSAVQGMLSGLAGGTYSLAVNIADVVGRISLAAVLAYSMLCERERLLLRMELLLPQAVRPTAVRMGNAVCRELRLYLRGQLSIALAVSALSCGSLALLGVRSALALGPIIGIFNMIPYFGPFIGGIPAMLIALGDGWRKAVMTLVALAAVQQLDGSLISPKIMGSLTGFSPALVLVVIYAGARLGGIGGMLLALPVMLTIRTLFRVFVQKCENI